MLVTRIHHLIRAKVHRQRIVTTPSVEFLDFCLQGRLVFDIDIYPIIYFLDILPREVWLSFPEVVVTNQQLYTDDSSCRAAWSGSNENDRPPYFTFVLNALRNVRSVGIHVPSSDDARDFYFHSTPGLYARAF